MIETATFVCSICNEPSLDICVYCTKDTCRNHRCERCKRCSDCCECEVHLVEPAREAIAAEPVILEADPLGSELSDRVVEVPPAPDAAVPLESEIPATEEPVTPDADILPAPPQASEEPDMNSPLAPPVDHFSETEPPTEPEHHE